MSLTKAMGCGRETPRARQPHDWYATPPEATRALLADVFGPVVQEPVWECACGDGAMARVLEATGFDVVATDLCDRGYGAPRVDFLQCEERLAPQIVTNPPFATAERFVAHAFALRASYAAFLLKANWFLALRGLGFFARYRPIAVLPPTWRPDFSGEGSPTMDCAWYVYRPTAEIEETQFRPLARPSSDRSAERQAGLAL